MLSVHWLGKWSQLLEMYLGGLRFWILRMLSQLKGTVSQYFSSLDFSSVNFNLSQLRSYSNSEADPGCFYPQRVVSSKRLLHKGVAPPPPVYQPPGRSLHLQKSDKIRTRHRGAVLDTEESNATITGTIFNKLDCGLFLLPDDLRFIFGKRFLTSGILINS